MNKISSLILTIFFACVLNAQVPEDALRLSRLNSSGTARYLAIGGAMGSLGGEITSAFVNPAGIGFYKNSEFILTPGFRFDKTKGAYRGSDKMSLGNANGLSFGTSGFVWGWVDKYSKWKSKAISLAVDQKANFRQDIFYSGTNDYSSFTENPTNEFFNFYTQQKNSDPTLPDSKIVDNALNSADISLPTKMGLYTYLIDIDSSSGQKQIISRAEKVALLGQQNRIKTKGGITEIAFAFAGNMDDKLYIGATFGLPIVTYTRDALYKESDATGNTFNKFNYFTFQENYSVSGVGINGKLGLIYKPQDFFRLGFAIHTPTLYGLKDKYSSKMVSDLENRFAPASGLDSVNSTVFTNNAPAEFKYDLVTPWKFIASGSYVFREIEDVHKQKGFITADVEYINYKWSKFSSSGQNGDNSGFKGVNSDIKDAYKGAFNFRVGGELKFNTFMGRLGFAYYGSPYQDHSLKAHQMYLSGGLGYRNKGIFIDLTYAHLLSKDAHFPYRLLAPRLNTYAVLNEGGGNLILTVGFKI